MKRIVGPLSLTCLFLLIGSQAMSQPAKEKDKVVRRDRKGVTSTATGTILDESPAGIRIKLDNKAKDEVIPGTEVQSVLYGDYAVPVVKAISTANGLEVARNYTGLIQSYEDILKMPEMRTVSPGARRYIEYRLLQTRATVAETDDQIKSVITSLRDFVKNNPQSYQFPLAARTLGRLLADTGDFAGALKVFEDLEKLASVPNEIKLEATAATIDIAYQAEKYDEVKAKLAKIQGDANASDSMKNRAAVYQLAIDAATGDLTATVKKIEESISKTQDGGLRGLCYNVLGDVYMAKGQKREAMWSYLWVDQVYNQDRGEHLKSMSRLIKIFEADNDPEKVKMYKEKVNRSR